MQVNLNPNITTNYNRQQNPNFGKVREDWLQKIIKHPIVADDDFTFELLDRTSDLTKTDFIDTIQESIKHVSVGFHEGLLDIIEWAKNAEIIKVKKSA